MSIWEKIRYFKPNESWGNPKLIDDMLLLALDEMRAYVEHPFIITSGTQGKHCLNSLHYIGKAVDFVVPKGINLFELYLTALRFPFTGVGVYPGWKYKGAVCGGLHVDVRLKKSHFERTSTWVGLEKNDNRVYMPASRDIIAKYVMSNLRGGEL